MKKTTREADEKYQKYMRRALQLAEHGAGWTAPNPLVGTVIIKNQRIIGEGYHQKFGTAHAEVNALTDAHQRGADVRGATMVSTLEPCTHFGHTPPCVDAIIKAGITKMIIATTDTNPNVAGYGVRILRDAGVEVVVGVLEKKALYQNRIFFHWVKKYMPYVSVKVAVSADGKITSTAGAPTKISSLASEKFTHAWRQHFDAILVGANTVRVDNPRLTVRYGTNPKNPIPIVLDGELRTPLTARVTADPRAIIATTPNAPLAQLRALRQKVNVIVLPATNGRIILADLLRELAKRTITSVLIEGGQNVLTQVCTQNMAHEWILIRAPQSFGAGVDFIQNPKEFDTKFTLINTKKSGADTIEFYQPKSTPEN